MMLAEFMQFCMPLEKRLVITFVCYLVQIQIKTIVFFIDRSAFFSYFSKEEELFYCLQSAYKICIVKKRGKMASIT